jgi:nucleoside-diphosphate-sugar epimerase
VTKRKVLVTGLAGRIGSVIRAFLGDKYELSGLDLAPVDGFKSRVADLADLDAIRPAFAGQDVVVHLGGDPNQGASWDSVLKNNIIGTYNVMEAAREAGVGRVVFASSNHVVGSIPLTQEPYHAIFEGRLEEVRWPFPLITTEAVQPCCNYGVGKAFGESLGSFYHDRHGISFIALRIGGVSMEEGWFRKQKAGLAMWLSHRDAAQLIDRSIDAPASVGFTIVYGMSANTLRVHEIESAQTVLGYRPQDDAGVDLDPGVADLPPYHAD